MFSKSNLLATLVGGIAMFVLGYVAWGMLGEGLLEDHSLIDVMKDPPDFIHLFLGCLLSAFALSTLYGKWARGYHGAKDGAEFGLWIGIFMGFGEGLIQFGTAKMMTFTGHLINAVIYIVFFIVIGAIISLMYKATSKKTSD